LFKHQTSLATLKKFLPTGPIAGFQEQSGSQKLVVQLSSI